MKLLTSCFCLSLRTSTKLVCKSFMVRFPFQCLLTNTNTEGLVCFIYFYSCSFLRRTSRTKSDFFIPRGGFPSRLEGLRPCDEWNLSLCRLKLWSGCDVGWYHSSKFLGNRLDQELTWDLETPHVNSVPILW